MEQNETERNGARGEHVTLLFMFVVVCLKLLLLNYVVVVVVVVDGDFCSCCCCGWWLVVELRMLFNLFILVWRVVQDINKRYGNAELII